MHMIIQDGGITPYEKRMIRGGSIMMTDNLSRYDILSMFVFLLGLNRDQIVLLFQVGNTPFLYILTPLSASAWVWWRQVWRLWFFQFNLSILSIMKHQIAENEESERLLSLRSVRPLIYLLENPHTL
ncbi:hypothetical protein MCOR02_002825 [Pyricularia oryzae]|nr:hypothetical protein MCOR02_002825 [Pyricularia oryzae]KAI6310371.1 hypothetical protein MCOR34_006420 [Pyricularia oryzae]KAI6312510.1 hypothetical protein MCOR29_007982 [Pyricularia oryzae]KAI6321083.1 hypothetical protein MCOR30_008103 [Pyricularia oryzae]KAI6462360.1 hypothetical protein MCOR15_004673 [Pyricularia oryzae]